MLIKDKKKIEKHILRGGEKTHVEWKRNLRNVKQ
jgi:hypothetical protein